MTSALCQGLHGFSRSVFTEFDRFNAARARVSGDTDQAIKWFADDAGAVLGAIAYHHADLDWSVVVLQRDGAARSSRLIAPLVSPSLMTRDACSLKR